MPNFSKVSSKSLVSVVSGGDDHFFEKMQYTLLLASTTESPVFVKKWLEGNQESILSYSAIIVIFDNVADTQSDEVLSTWIGHIVPHITGTTENPLSSHNILLCKDTHSQIISSFCEAYTLDKESLLENVSGISYWSILRQSKLDRSTALRMNGQAFYQ
jgi:hypothetical protein